MFLKRWPHCFVVTMTALLVLGLVLPIYFQLILSLQPSASKEEVFGSQRNLEYEIKLKQSQIKPLEKHLEDLNRVKISSVQYLTQLDQKLLSMKLLIDERMNYWIKLEKKVKTNKQIIENLLKESENVRNSIKQVDSRSLVYVAKPLVQSLTQPSLHLQTYMNNTICNFITCFDYSRCQYVEKFTMNLYKLFATDEMFNGIISQLKHSPSSDPCLVVVFINMDHSVNEINKKLALLPSWKRTGRNHLLYLSYENSEGYCQNIQKLNVTEAMLVLTLPCAGFRSEFNFMVPLVYEISTLKLPALLPITRKYLLTFYSACPQRSAVLRMLKENFRGVSDVKIFISCSSVDDCAHKSCPYRFHNVSMAMRQSIFALLLVGENEHFLDELIRSLRNGAIPVVLGAGTMLPLSNEIDWKKAAVILPQQRIPELIFMLRTLHRSDVSSMKIHGRFLLETYFSSPLNVLWSVVEAFKHRASVMGDFLEDVPPVKFIYPKQVSKSEHNVHFVQNFTFIGKNAYRLWNRYPGALHLYPVTPWTEPLPSLYQFSEEGRDHFLPIGNGLGGDGVAFSRSLGGDMQFEEFTVVMLTYDREQILMEALLRLSGMRYLNKVIVVWNYHDDPSHATVWPDIGVKIEVVRAQKNSLNNRFIPYSNIETEAVLSLDDDIYLRHDEIELAFRVWRGNRDRLVGFPGRHHAYNASKHSFDYNSEHSCELSLVLTGGAFFHKYYAYMYTHHMYPSIREMVDNFLNCEDIAMNFLVAHVTQKPPIKVTSRWTFRCPGCPASLSNDDNHYLERNECMTYFEKVYGYNPLKRTQYRVDSVLFKTRLPSGLTKCFPYV